MFEDEDVDAPTYPVEMIPVELIDDFEGNPQVMSDATFSALVEEIAESGWTVPVQVVGPMPDGRYKMVGGHHRKKAAKVLGYSRIPGMLLPPDQFNEDIREIQVVKQNVLAGELNPEKFTTLFNRIAEKYGTEMTRTMMGFTQADAFKRVYQEAKKGLPPEMAARLDETKQELKTVDDLSLILNKIFNEFGDTLKFHGLFFTWGGREHLMIQLDQPGAWKRVKKFMQWCVENELLVDEEFMTRMDWPRGV